MIPHSEVRLYRIKRKVLRATNWPAQETWFLVPCGAEQEAIDRKPGSYSLPRVARGKSDLRFWCTHTTSQGSTTTQSTAIQRATLLAKNLPSNSVPSHPPQKAANAPMQSMAGHFFLSHDGGQDFARTANRPISRPSRSQKQERASITTLIS